MKRGKLILSLSLMCLAIAVLCFGVLAATSVTYTISGTISYEVSDVFVKINTRVFGVTAQQDKATVIANVKTLETKALDSIADSTYKLSQTMDEYDSTSADTGSVSGINLTYGGTNGYYTYYIVINIKNLSSSKDVYAKVTDNTTAEVNSIKTTNLYQNAIKSTETKNIVIAYSIKDKTSSIDSESINYSLKVSYETTAYTSGANITSETINSVQGYYITLGKTSTSATTDNIKWRLVSLDGTSKYTYSADDKFNEGDSARYLTDAVFLQETYLGSTCAFDEGDDESYYRSDIREKINDLTTWSINEANISSLIKKKNIKEIKKCWHNADILYTGTTDDYFWLLSEDESDVYLGTQYSEKKMCDESGNVARWWLRNGYYGDNYVVGGVKYEIDQVLMSDGATSMPKASDKCGIRAAFTLA